MDNEYDDDLSLLNNKKGDLYQLSNNFYNLLNFKIGFLLFLIYIILNTDIFVENVLTKIFNNVYNYPNDKITTKGIIISSIILSLFYILIDFLDKVQYI